MACIAGSMPNPEALLMLLSRHCDGLGVGRFAFDEQFSSLAAFMSFAQLAQSNVRFTCEQQENNSLKFKLVWKILSYVTLGGVLFVEADPEHHLERARGVGEGIRKLFELLNFFFAHIPKYSMRNAKFSVFLLLQRGKGNFPIFLPTGSATDSKWDKLFECTTFLRQYINAEKYNSAKPT